MLENRLNSLAGPPRRGENDDRVLPLINVVFLLLVFFMLAGRLSSSDPIVVEPPESASEGPVADEPIIVYLAADGRMALGDGPVARDRLAAGLREQIHAAPDARVQVKADARVEAMRVVEIMGLLRDTGVKKVSLLTVREKY